MNVYRSSDVGGGKTLGTVAFCTRDHLNASTATCLWSTDWSWIPQERSVQRFITQGSILTMQRNECLKRMEGDWLLFIDDDMVWEPDAVGRLVKSWEEAQAQFDDPVILGALCHRRAAPHDPTLYVREPDSGRYRFVEKWDTDYVEIDATGCAFLLIPATAIERMVAKAGTTWPSFEDRQHLLPPPIFRWDGTFGEDLSFCADARSAGCHILVDTRIQIGHIAEVTVDHRSFLREIAERDPFSEEKVRFMNEKIGIPTMTAEEARARLAGR